MQVDKEKTGLVEKTEFKAMLEVLDVEIEEIESKIEQFMRQGKVNFKRLIRHLKSTNEPR